MKTITTQIIAFSLLTTVACSNAKDNDSSIVKIDADKDYPVLNLKLTDIADVSYIPLKGSSNPSLMQISPVVQTFNIFIAKDRLFILDRNRTDSKILVYDYSGKPLYRIGRHGNGPGELSYDGFRFTVDIKRNEVYIWDSNSKLFVFDLNGSFIKSQTFDRNLIGFYSYINNINDKTLMVFSGQKIKLIGEWLRKQTGHDKVWDSGKRSLIFIDKDNLTLVDHPDINFTRPHTDAVALNSALLSSENGTYFFTLCSDTTYFIDRNLKIIPKFVDVTKYNKNKYKTQNNIDIFPIAEFGRYIFLSTEIALSYGEKPDPGDFKYLVYDKKTKKLYSCPKVKTNAYNSESLHFAFPGGGSMNPGFLVKCLPLSFLKKEYKNLPLQLRKIVDQGSENDGPVLLMFIPAMLTPIPG
jgi:hypothetical protein